MHESCPFPDSPMPTTQAHSLELIYPLPSVSAPRNPWHLLSPAIPNASLTTWLKSPQVSLVESWLHCPGWNSILRWVLYPCVPTLHIIILANSGYTMFFSSPQTWPELSLLLCFALFPHHQLSVMSDKVSHDHTVVVNLSVTWTDKSLLPQGTISFRVWWPSFLQEAFSSSWNGPCSLGRKITVCGYNSLNHVVCWGWVVHFHMGVCIHAC